MPTHEDVVCERCGTNLVRHGDTVDGFASFYQFFEDTRADLHVECPDCGHEMEMEVQLR